ncbi:MAG: chromosomal replication initiator protein DnaA [Candidatus Berkelbacteria bacterium]|nr:chromosomal replication initiator protein DnaA [Candidatus Berkelbacteria bacterium]
MDLVETWRNALGELQVTLSKANFETWFKTTFIFEYKKGVFTIGVPTFFVEDWLKKKYLKDIQKALQNQIDDPIQLIKFKIATPQANQIISLDKDSVIHRAVDKPQPKIQSSSVQILTENPMLIDNYIFSTFVVGPSNQLAFAAAGAVVEKPGSQYNPLFIYGDSGLGKTHLMQAIGHAFLAKYPEKKVLYVSTETFVNDFIQAVSAGFGKAKDFKNRYRNVDLLLIDDVQFLSSKEGTQDEFFHTFNHLHQNKKQVILTADRVPKDIKGLEIRLKTRFEGGMVCDVGHPDLETREAILHQKAKAMGKQIDSKILTLIAQNVKSSIRELEGALNKFLATCELTNSEMTEAKAMEVLNNLIEEKQQYITPELVIREVHRYFRIGIEDLLGQKRTKELVLPRQITMYLLRHECNMSFPEIGRKMGGKDHSTIMHGTEKIEKNISMDHRLKEDLNLIKEKIHASYN